MAGWWRAHTVLSPGDRRGPENERWCVAEHERARKGPAGHRRRRESLTVRRALQIMSRRSTPKPARFGLRPSKHEHYYCTITGLFAFLLPLTYSVFVSVLFRNEPAWPLASLSPPPPHLPTAPTSNPPAFPYPNQQHPTAARPVHATHGSIRVPPRNAGYKV